LLTNRRKCLLIWNI